MIPSTMTAVLQILRDTQEIVDLLDESLNASPPTTSLPADDRIFVNRIPREVIEDSDPHLPPKMLVVAQGGGAAKSDYLPLDSPSVTLLAYGETDFEADRLRRAAWARLQFLDREFVADVLIHAVNATSGPIPNVDPSTKWPAVAQTYSMQADISEV